MAYATVDDVRGRNAARTISETSKPSQAQVERFLAETAGIIDGILAGQDYVLPITGDQSLEALRYINATGAWSLTEQASASSPHVEGARIAWQSAIKMLREGLIHLPDAERVAATSMPSTHPKATPMFSLDMEF